MCSQFPFEHPWCCVNSAEITIKWTQRQLRSENVIISNLMMNFHHNTINSSVEIMIWFTANQHRHRPSWSKALESYLSMWTSSRSMAPFFILRYLYSFILSNPPLLATDSNENVWTSVHVWKQLYYTPAVFVLLAPVCSPAARSLAFRTTGAARRSQRVNRRVQHVHSSLQFHRVSKLLRFWVQNCDSTVFMLGLEEWLS